MCKLNEDSESDTFQFVIFSPKADRTKLSTDLTALLDFLKEEYGMPKDAFSPIKWVAGYR